MSNRVKSNTTKSYATLKNGAVLCVQIFASVTDQICPEGSSILMKPCLHLSDISRLMKIMNHFVEQ
ncbi:MAG: hypothetical protein ACRCSC_02300, partial [Lactococcus garvieae]